VIVYMVTHSKCGESDGAFTTYEEAKAHYDYLCSEGDPDSARYYFIEEVNEDDLQDSEEYWRVNPTKNDEEE